MRAGGVSAQKRKTQNKTSYPTLKASNSSPKDHQGDAKPWDEDARIRGRRHALQYGLGCGLVSPWPANVGEHDSVPPQPCSVALVADLSCLPIMGEPKAFLVIFPITLVFHHCELLGKVATGSYSLTGCKRRLTTTWSTPWPSAPVSARKRPRGTVVNRAKCIL